MYRKNVRILKLKKLYLTLVMYNYYSSWQNLPWIKLKSGPVLRGVCIRV